VPVLHPPLLAIYRVLLLYANNMEKTPLAAVVRPALMLALGAVALWIALWVVLRNRYKAGIVASILVVAGLTGWHVLEYTIDSYLPLLAGFPQEGFYFLYAAAIGVGLLFIAKQNWNRPTRAAWLMAASLVGAVAVMLAVVFLLAPAYGTGPAWAMVVYAALVVGLLAYVLLRKGQFTAITQTANWFAIILVAISVALIVVHRPAPQTPAAAALEAAPLAGTDTATAKTSTKPDIYFIVLEGYARDDVLRNDYGYNEMPFFETMRQKGFWIAEKSYANYSDTVPSLASCFNMDLVQELLPVQNGTTESGDLLSLLNYNRVFALLKKQGYETIAFSPGSELLEPRSNMDVVLKPAHSLSEFESVLMETSMVARAFEMRDYWRYGSTFHSSDLLRRQRVLFTRYELGRLAPKKASGPRFVFAPMLVPEPPFVFARDGKPPRDVPTGTRTSDAARYTTTLSQYRRAYVDQLHFTNTMLTKVVDEIISRNSTPPVILIVSSRGPGLEVDSEMPTSEQIRERLGILMMAYVPGLTPAQALLPEDKACLLNLFRATFGHVFGLQLPLKSAGAFISSSDEPGKFRSVPVDTLVH
jgi:hypothetical protein